MSGTLLVTVNVHGIGPEAASLRPEHFRSHRFRSSIGSAICTIRASSMTTHLTFSMKMVAQAWLNCHSRRGLSTRRISGAGSLKTGLKPISRKSLTDCLVTQAMLVSAYIRAPIWASLAPHA